MLTSSRLRAPRRADGPAIIRSGRVNRTRSGEVYDRSIPLSPGDAKRFAAALAALPGFVDVSARSTKRTAADGRTWFVRWHRAAAAQPAAAAGMQEIRAERALHQLGEMEWFRADDDPDSTSRHCLHFYPDSEAFGLYLVSVSPVPGVSRCSCPDFAYRMSRAGGPCKHIEALRMELRLPLPRIDTGHGHETTEERRARIRRDNDLDFN